MKPSNDSAGLGEAPGADSCLSSPVNFTVLCCGVENKPLTVLTTPGEIVCLKKVKACEETLSSHISQIGTPVRESST